VKIHVRTKEFTAEDNPVMDWHPIQGGVERVLDNSCCSDHEKLWLYGTHAPMQTSPYQSLLSDHNNDTIG